MATMATMAQVLEDNGGGIHWATADGRSCSSNGIAPTDWQAGKLVAELVVIAPTDWQAGKLVAADLVKMDQDGMTVIAEIDDAGVVTLYTERMGSSGRNYAGTAGE